MSFTDPPEGDADPRPIIAELIETCPEFDLLRTAQPKIAVFMRMDPKMRGGKRVLGMLALPHWQGSLGPLALWLLAQHHGDYPDFIMVLDAEFWEGATREARHALVHHELSHAMQARDKEGEPRFTDEGLPVWAIAEHDIAEFNNTVRRYGPWLDDIRDFLTAARENRV